MQTVINTGKHTAQVPDGATVGGTITDSKITKLAFRQRFTFAERVAIETEAETDASVRVMLKDQEAASFIDLSRQDTIDGVNALAAATLITEQRASEILNNPIQDIERP
jgi:hypothetical protein